MTAVRILSYNIHKGLTPANRRFVLERMRTEFVRWMLTSFSYKKSKANIATTPTVSLTGRSPDSANISLTAFGRIMRMAATRFMIMAITAMRS